MSDFKFGAKPPPGLEWMMGRSVDEIDAIQYEAEVSGKESSEVAKGSEWQKWLLPGAKG